MSDPLDITMAVPVDQLLPPSVCRCGQDHTFAWNCPWIEWFGINGLGITEDTE